MPLDAADDHVQRHQILSALGHDDVGVLLARLHVPLVHGLDRVLILLQYAFQSSSPLVHVPLDPAAQTNIRVGVHKNPDVHEVAQFLVLEDQNALHDHHLGGVHLHRFVGAVVDGVVVHGAVDGLTPLQRLQVLDHQVGVEGVGMVVVLQAALGEGPVLPLVVVVVVYHADVAAEACSQVLGERGLAAAGAVGDADENGVSARCEQLYSFFVNLTSRFCTNNDLYYTVDGKPMIVVWNADKLYARDSEKLYNTIRERVRENVKDGNGNGLEIYILARQERWTPPARWHNFFLSGKVDAVYMDNMYNQTDWFRPTCYPQCIDQNFKYNREYEWANYGVDFVPSVSPSFNQWIDGDGTQFYNFPVVFKDEDMFRKMCNVAKMNLGKRPMVIIDSFNRWNVDQAIEPTDPNYGNGYGMKYLNIVKEEFKVK